MQSDGLRMSMSVDQKLHTCMGFVQLFCLLKGQFLLQNGLLFLKKMVRVKKRH